MGLSERGATDLARRILGGYPHELVHEVRRRATGRGELTRGRVLLQPLHHALQPAEGSPDGARVRSPLHAHYPFRESLEVDHCPVRVQGCTVFVQEVGAVREAAVAAPQALHGVAGCTLVGVGSARRGSSGTTSRVPARPATRQLPYWRISLQVACGRWTMVSYDCTRLHCLARRAGSPGHRSGRSHRPVSVGLYRGYGGQSERIMADPEMASFLARGDLNALLLDAESGSADVQFRLGLEFYHGGLVKKDYQAATRLYRRAAVQNHPRAQACLGCCYNLGRGVQKNQRMAIHWWMKAASNGDLVSHANLALAYAHGDGVKRDPTEARRRFALSRLEETEPSTK